MKTIRILLFILLFNCLFLCSCGDDYVLYSEDEVIVIDLKGKVRFPGSYEFMEPVTLGEVIRIAGGLLYTADESSIDYELLLEKSCTIVIPSVQANDEKTDLININKATISELMMLPRIGEAMAKRIIEYRNENGAFKRIEEIMNVPGIKENIFNQIKDLITV